MLLQGVGRPQDEGELSPTDVTTQFGPQVGVRPAATVSKDGTRSC